MMNKLKRLYDKKISSDGIGIFRILYFTVLLFEVNQIYFFKELIFDYIPFIDKYEIDFGPALLAWQIVIVLLVFGAYTRYLTILNYCFSLVFISTINSFEYHVFYTYMGMNFIAIFLPLHKSFSLDNLRLKLKYSNTRISFYPNQNTSVLNYLIPVFLGVGLVYFDSVLFKLSSHNWTSGIGVWLPATLPHITHLDFQWILNQKWLQLGMGYFTLLFEAIFLLIFWRKRFRTFLMISGLLLHVGIYIVFPIPYFATAVIAVYVLLVPVHYWRKLWSLITYTQPKITFYYDEECPLCIRTKLIISHFDMSNAISFKGLQSNYKKNKVLQNWTLDDLLDNIYSMDRRGRVFTGYQTYCMIFSNMTFLWPFGWLMRLPVIKQIGSKIYSTVAVNRITQRCTESNCGYEAPQFPITADHIKLLKNLTIKRLKICLLTLGLTTIILLQLNVSFKSGILYSTRPTLLALDISTISFCVRVSDYIHAKSKTYLGITTHPVFMDVHFDNYNHIIALTCINENGSEAWLPIINKKGMPDEYNTGFNWVKWTFRVNNAEINNDKLSEGMIRFISFWSHKNDIDLSQSTFKVKVKRINVPKKWQKNFLSDQISNPWIDAGTIKWDKGQFNVVLSEIEKIELSN